MFEIIIFLKYHKYLKKLTIVSVKLVIINTYDC